MCRLNVFFTCLFFLYKVKAAFDYHNFEKVLFNVNERYYTPLPTSSYSKRYVSQNDKNTLSRVLQSMKAYYDDEEIQFKRLTPQRLIYEKSAPYEAGYILSEVLERYKLMSNQCPNAHKGIINTDYQSPNADLIMELILKLNCIQKTYFDILYLTNMMHELPKKYNYVTTPNPFEELHEKNKMIMWAAKKRDELNLTANNEINPYNLANWLDNLSLFDK